MQSHTNEPSVSLGMTRRRTIAPLTLIASIVVALIVGYGIGSRFNVIGLFGQKSTNEINYAAVDRIYRELRSNYDGTLDIDKLTNGASRGLVDAAGDPYTIYMDAKEAEVFKRDLTGDVGAGIGAEVGVRGGQPTIVRVLPDHPAEKVGLRAGDTIIAVNDRSTKSLALDKTIEQLRGVLGSTVKVTVLRSGEPIEFSIVRARIVNPSVRSSIEQGIGVIKVTRFDQETGDLVRRAADSLISQRVQGMILDLRDNGGGYVTAAQDVAGVWLENRRIMTEKSGDKIVDSVSSRGGAIAKGVKTVVLINGGSASASEIIAGAFQEYRVATLVGEKTFGKGTVQKMIDLTDGGILKVTIARWYTPEGRNITKEGIHPDQTVEMTAKDVDAGRDPQLEASLRVFS